MTLHEMPSLVHGDLIRLVLESGCVIFGTFRRMVIPAQGDALIQLRQNDAVQSFGIATIRQIQEAR